MAHDGSFHRLYGRIVHRNVWVAAYHLFSHAVAGNKISGAASLLASPRPSMAGAAGTVKFRHGDDGSAPDQQWHHRFRFLPPLQRLDADISQRGQAARNRGDLRSYPASTV